jgi:hypothetical protein
MAFYPECPIRPAAKSAPSPKPGVQATFGRRAVGFMPDSRVFTIFPGERKWPALTVVY